MKNLLANLWINNSDVATLYYEDIEDTNIVISGVIEEANIR
jgi:hypothetical protein